MKKINLSDINTVLVHLIYIDMFANRTFIDKEQLKCKLHKKRDLIFPQIFLSHH